MVRLARAPPVNPLNAPRDVSPSRERASYPARADEFLTGRKTFRVARTVINLRILFWTDGVYLYAGPVPFLRVRKQ